MDDLVLAPPEGNFELVIVCPEVSEWFVKMLCPQSKKLLVA
jgi:hypothetical protein